VLCVIYIETYALIAQLPFQSKLGKYRIFPVIVVSDTAVVYQFWKVFYKLRSTILLSFNFTSAKSVQYMASCLWIC